MLAATALRAHVAQEQGFFEEHGLDVKLTEAGHGPEIVPVLTVGSTSRWDLL